MLGLKKLIFFLINKRFKMFPINRHSTLINKHYRSLSQISKQAGLSRIIYYYQRCYLKRTNFTKFKDIVKVANLNKKLQTKKFIGGVKTSPIWIDEVKWLPISSKTECIIIDAGELGGARSLINTTINKKNIVSVTANSKDFLTSLNNLIKYKLPGKVYFGPISSHIGKNTSYNIIIHDGTNSSYGSIDDEYGMETTWINAILQDLPWLYIWNCISQRSRHGNTVEVGLINMYNMMVKLCEVSGYRITQYIEGKHISSGRNPMSNTSFYLVKNGDKFNEADKLNRIDKILKLMRIMRINAPKKIWNFNDL